MNWWLSAAEAADLAGVTVNDIQRAAHLREIAKQGRSWHLRYRRADVERLAAEIPQAFGPVSTVTLQSMAEAASLITDVTGLSPQQVREAGGTFQRLPPKRIIDRFRILRRQAAEEMGSRVHRLRLEARQGRQTVLGLEERRWTPVAVAEIPELSPEQFLGCLVWAAAQGVASGVRATEDHWSHQHFLALVDLRRSGLLGESA